MLGNQQFYHRSIRKTIVAFGSLFNDLEIVRFDTNGDAKERIKVPLSLGLKEKYITRIESDPTLTKSVSVVLPRMSFNLDGLQYDSMRKQISTLRNFNNTPGGFVGQYVPIPYNFNFTLSIFVRNMEDGVQILEQILPFFTPDFTVTLNYIDSISKKYDIPFVLDDVQSNIEYEGDFTTVRVITWDLKFTAKAYIWPPISDVGIIREINVNMNTDFEANTANTPLVNINIVPNPIDAEPNSVYEYTTTITENINE